MSADLVNMAETDRLPLKQFFGITDAYDTGYGKDLDFINEWAKEKKLTKEDMLLELKKVEQRMGTPMAGENRWHRVKHYISLDEKLTRTLKEMSAYERGNL
jgi:hypothetical protein